MILDGAEAPKIFFDASLIGVARVVELQDDRIVYPGHPLWPYDQTVDDEVWLQYVGDHGWCAILRDKKIRYREAEKAALERHEVRAVVIATGRNLTIADNAALLTKYWAGIADLFGSPPGYYHLTMSGLSLRLEY